VLAELNVFLCFMNTAQAKFGPGEKICPQAVHLLASSIAPVLPSLKRSFRIGTFSVMLNSPFIMRLVQQFQFDRIWIQQAPASRPVTVPPSMWARPTLAPST